MEFLGNAFNFWNLFLASLFFILAYTWTTKTSSDIPEADHINRLQNLKLDNDGEIAWTGTSQWKKGSDVASASNLQPGSDGNYFDVTGTTGITQITPAQSQPGTLICLHFDSSLTITHDGDYIVIPGGSNLTVAAGSEVTFLEYTAGKFRLINYFASPADNLAQLSGQAGSAFDWANQNLLNVNNLPTKTTGAWSKTIGSGGDYADWASMIADMPDLIAHAVTVTIKTGTTLTEICGLNKKNGLTSAAQITVQAEDYFPQSGTLPTATGATATTLEDTNQSWAVDRFIDCWVLIVDGTGTDNGFVQITDSDATSITVASWPGTQPDNTSRYLIVGALVDGEGSRYRCFEIENNTIWTIFYGIGCKNATHYGIAAHYLNAQFLARWCGFYGNSTHGIFARYSADIYIHYCGLVNNVNYGIQCSAVNRGYVRDCGISDNGTYGILGCENSYILAKNNYGDGNGTWGAYAQSSAQIDCQGTECSGSSGNHSDPGTAGTAGADQAAAY